jgi:hypothetical protein
MPVVHSKTRTSKQVAVLALLSRFSAQPLP